MSVLRKTSFNISYLFVHISQIIKRIFNHGRAPRSSSWYKNASGNFAVKASVVPTANGLLILLRQRKGWHRGQYTYSRCSISYPDGMLGFRSFRNVFNFACRSAEHLARYRYRYQ